MGQSENISLGGLLLQTSDRLEPQTQLEVLFNLPTGHSIRTQTIVVHSDLRSRAGIQFRDLPQEVRQQLEEFIANQQSHVRRGARVAKRFNVTLRGTLAGKEQEEIAETVLISARGGLLVCRAEFTLGQGVFLWWPQAKRGAKARIVFRNTIGHGDLVELGLEFESSEDFWGLDLPANH